jgi:hypothetical protein
MAKRRVKPKKDKEIDNIIERFDKAFSQLDADLEEFNEASLCDQLYADFTATLAIVSFKIIVNSMTNGDPEVKKKITDSICAEWHRKVMITTNKIVNMHSEFRGKTKGKLKDKIPDEETVRLAYVNAAKKIEAEVKAILNDSSIDTQ